MTAAVKICLESFSLSQGLERQKVKGIAVRQDLKGTFDLKGSLCEKN